jgi:hypothetical protein
MLSPDVTPLLPEPAIENASAARTVMRANNMAPSAALEAVTAAPQPLSRTRYGRRRRNPARG